MSLCRFVFFIFEYICVCVYACMFCVSLYITLCLWVYEHFCISTYMLSLYLWFYPAFLPFSMFCWVCACFHIFFYAHIFLYILYSCHSFTWSFYTCVYTCLHCLFKICYWLIELLYLSFAKHFVFVLVLVYIHHSLIYVSSPWFTLISFLRCVLLLVHNAFICD